TLRSMGIMIRALVAASLCFVLSECSLKWDAKFDKNTIVDSEQLNLALQQAPANYNFCHWEGCDPGNYCSSGTYVGRIQGGWSPYAGNSGFCWLGINYLCCDPAHIHKGIEENCFDVDRLYRPNGCDGKEIAIQNNAGWLCCNPGTIV
ncbi:hypothetical protein PENTCL1PPCAC_10277, partial [Pristionchus entomophagus]